MLEALLLFLDFPPRLPLLFAALLPAAAAKRTPFTGLDFPAEVYREHEQDDHADDRPGDCPRLPPRLANVDRRGALVLRGDPRVRFRLVEDIHLQGLVSLTVEADGEHELHRGVGADRITGRVPILVEPLGLTGDHGGDAAADRADLGRDVAGRRPARFVRHVYRDGDELPFRRV